MTKAFQKNTDSKLVAAAKGKESQAFELLVRRHETKMFAMAFRITRNREDAQDVVQQSFYKAFVHLDAFQGKSSFATWMTRIVMNEAFMCLRKNRTLGKAFLEEPESAEIRDPGESPEQIYGKHENQRILSQAIKQLGSELRTALCLRLEERTMQETAEILGIRVVTLKARLFRARQKLRILLSRGPEFVRFGQDAHLGKNKRQLASAI